MLLKISKFLETLSFKLRQKALYLELKHYIVATDESYMKKVYDFNRGIGKTYTLVQLSHELDVPIAVPYKSTEKHIQTISKKLYGEPVEIVVANQWTRGKRYHTVLCEEGLSQVQLREIIRPMCKQMVGYINER